MVPVLFLVVSALGAWRTWNALRPVRPGRGLGPVWVSALVTGELALHQIAWQAAATAVFVWAGALRSWPGLAGLAITGASWAGLVVLQVRAHRARPTVEAAVTDALGRGFDGQIDPDRFADRLQPSLPRLMVAHPSKPRNVERRSGLAYGPHPSHLVDLYLPPATDGPAPVLLQIHGGSWMRGRRDRHARPLMHHMAQRGWICAAIDYRLSPEATFPDHLEDVKRAIWWLRHNAPDYGADPTFIAATGGSAGGHLAALAALTAGQPRYQPGFEDADTSLQACVPFYGIFRLTSRDGTRARWTFLEKHVMKSSPSSNPRLWTEASPAEQAHGGVPPFLIVHGRHDSLVTVDESARFAAALRAAGDGPVGYAEIPGATHGFDYFYSVRSAAAVSGVGRFLAAVYAAHQAGVRPARGRGGDPASR